MIGELVQFIVAYLPAFLSPGRCGRCWPDKWGEAVGSIVHV